MLACGFSVVRIAVPGLTARVGHLSGHALRRRHAVRTRDVIHLPVIVGERDSHELQIGDATGVRCPVDLNQAFRRRCDHLRGRHVFAARVIVESLGRTIEIELAGAIEQFVGILYVEGPAGVQSCAVEHRTCQRTVRLLQLKIGVPSVVRDVAHADDR